MPKPKPDQTIRHEIVLSRPDRELLSDVVVAYQINKVATPLVSLVSDASAMTLILGILEAYGVIDLIPATVYEQLKEGMYDSYKAGMDAFRDAVDLEPQMEEAADYTSNLAVQAWVWLVTSGRILTEQVTGDR